MCTSVRRMYDTPSAAAGRPPRARRVPVPGPVCAHPPPSPRLAGRLGRGHRGRRCCMWFFVGDLHPGARGRDARPRPGRRRRCWSSPGTGGAAGGCGSVPRASRRCRTTRRPRPGRCRRARTPSGPAPRSASPRCAASTPRTSATRWRCCGCRRCPTSRCRAPAASSRRSPRRRRWRPTRSRPRRTPPRSSPRSSVPSGRGARPATPPSGSGCRTWHRRSAAPSSG